MERKLTYMNNSTAKGDSLRDKVYDLVKAAQKRSVEKEKNINGKKADVYFEDSSTFQKTLRIAVECKNYSKSFDRSLFGEIYNEYLPVKDAIDCLVIITINKPTSSVSESLNSYDWIRHYTWSEFVSTLMDFSTYLQTLKARFANEGLEDYYVPVITKENEDLDSVIQKWVEDENDCQARAILAGYGMGKSSFAKYTAYKFANMVNAGTTKRIPIYLKLGEIYNEQSLDGLLGKHLASEYIVRGYNFELFQALNRNGLLLVILDGFDEMKHAMSKEEFAANLKQFDKLIVSKSKVLILGRPSAFISTNEYESAIKGRENSDHITISSVKSYKEIELAEFNQEQLEVFIPKYLEYENCQATQTEGISRSSRFIKERVIELFKGDFSELIGRPVHAKMLCMLAIRNEEKLEQFTRYKLYKSFLGEILKREYEKKARVQLDKEARKKFIQWVAWENWPTKGITGFTYDELKENPNYKKDDVSKAGQDMLREQLVGSILDTKSHGVFFFSHRSFQEYLVAEYMLNNSWTVKQLSSLGYGLNEEIVSFLEESNCQTNFADKIFKLLTDCRDSLTNNIIRFLWGNFDFYRLDRDKKLEVFSPWQAYILSAQGHFDASLLLENIALIDNLSCELAASVVLGISDKPNLSRDDVVKISALIVRKNRNILSRGEYHLGVLKNQVSLKNTSERIWVRMFIGSIKGTFNSKNELESISISISDLQRVIDANVKGVSFSNIPRIGNKDSKTFKIGNINEICGLLFDDSSKPTDTEKNNIIELKKKLVMFLRSKLEPSFFVEVANVDTKTSLPTLSLKTRREQN